MTEQRILCDRCDGCGWMEGDVPLGKACKACNGKGVVNHHGYPILTEAEVIEMTKNAPPPEPQKPRLGGVRLPPRKRRTWKK